jgi:hypothetical protein
MLIGRLSCRRWIRVPAAIVLTSAWLAAAPISAADCSADPANILEHCGFQSATNVTTPTEWKLTGAGAPCFATGSYSHDATDGSNTPPPSLASMVANTVLDSTVHRFDFCQCEDSPPAGSYGYGIDLRGPAGLTIFACSVSIQSATGAGCTGTIGTLDTASITMLTGAWQQIGGGGGDIAVVPAATAAVRFDVTCFMPDPGASQVFRLDNAFLGVGSTPVELQSFEVD